MSRSYAALVLLAGLVLAATGVHGQTCPIQKQTAEMLDFVPITGPCGSLNSGVSRDSCDSCICALIDVIVPALDREGFNLADVGGFSAAEALLSSCISVLFAPLSRAQVSVATLARLGSCDYTPEEYPDCVEPYLTQETPQPADGGDGDECECTEEFDPVCDYNGQWFTNLCVAKCQGVKIVERCSPVFKEVEEKEEPFILTENDGPLIWKPGCACSQTTKDAQPVCDIDGNQYASRCYAECQGVTEVFDCGSLVVDFLPSGEGPLVEALDGKEPKTDKPDVGGTPNVPPPVAAPSPDAPEPPAEPEAEPEPEPKAEPEPEPKTKPTKDKPKKKPKKPKKDPKEDVIVPPEVISIFDQFGIDANSLPPELTLLAYKVISNEQLTDQELETAREIISDDDEMEGVREAITPAYAQQLRIFAESATGNNKMLLQELSDALAEPSTAAAPPSENTDPFTKCIKSCKPGKMVCSQSTGIKFESGCHARCAGVTDISSCEKKEEPKKDNGGVGTCAGILVPLLSMALTAFFITIR